jgi:hypothetical protein
MEKRNENRQENHNASFIHKKISKNTKKEIRIAKIRMKEVLKMTHSELKEKALTRKKVKAEYEALEPEFKLLREMLKARRKAGLSQAEIAE